MKQNLKGNVMSIESKVKEIVVELLGVAAVSVESSSDIVEDLAADSLDVVEMIMALEEDFNIEISDEDAEQAKTIADVAKLVERLLEQ